MTINAHCTIMHVMTIMECALDVGRVSETVRKWIREGRLKAKRVGLKELFIEPDEWERFCTANNMAREADR